MPSSQLKDQSKNELEIKDKSTLRDHDKRKGVTSGAVVIPETPHNQHKPSTKKATNKSKPFASSHFHPQDSQDETVSMTVAQLEHSNHRAASRIPVVTMDNSTNKDQPFNNNDLNVQSKKTQTCSDWEFHGSEHW